MTSISNCLSLQFGGSSFLCCLNFLLKKKKKYIYIYFFLLCSFEDESDGSQTSYILVWKLQVLSFAFKQNQKKTKQTVNFFGSIFTPNVQFSTYFSFYSFSSACSCLQPYGFNLHPKVQLVLPRSHFPNC